MSDGKIILLNAQLIILLQKHLHQKIPGTRPLGEQLNSTQILADMAEDLSNSIKDNQTYEALRDKGYSKEKLARRANTESSKAGKKGGSKTCVRRMDKK